MSTHIVIATALYEAGRPYIADWSAGIRRAIGERRDVAIVAAVDDLADPETALEPLSEVVNIHFVSASGSITDVRRLMLQAASDISDDFIILSDCDDIPLGGSIEALLSATHGVNFAAGNLQSVSIDGQYLDHTLFKKGSMTKDYKEPTSLLAGNPFGLTNAILSKYAIGALPRTFPNDILALDWWMFTHLLYEGLVGRTTADIVACYRHHGGSAASIGIPHNPVAFERAVSTIIRHLNHFRQLPGAEQLLEGIQQLEPPRDPTPLPDTGIWHASLLELAVGQVERDEKCVSP